MARGGAVPEGWGMPFVERVHCGCGDFGRGERNHFMSFATEVGEQDGDQPQQLIPTAFGELPIIRFEGAPNLLVTPFDHPVIPTHSFLTGRGFLLPDGTPLSLAPLTLQELQTSRLGRLGAHIGSKN